MKFSYNGFIDRLIASAGDAVISHGRERYNAWRNRGWYSVEMEYLSEAARGVILLADKSEEAKSARRMRVNNIYSRSIGEHIDTMGPAPDGFAFTTGGIKCEIDKAVEGTGDDVTDLLVLRVEGSNENLRRVLDAAHMAIKQKTKNEITHHSYSPMRGWNKGGAVPRRDIGSVLWGEESACLPGDIARFLASEGEYVKRGQTWKRVYLLHGPPGGGKSSAIKAIASSINANIYILSCKGMGEADLADAISRVEPGSILVTEEVDGVWSARGEAEEDDTLRMRAAGSETIPPLTLEALLQAADGITTPHGLIWFMTTNYPEKLSPRLTRSRRIDKSIFFGPATEAQVKAGESLWGVKLSSGVRAGLVGKPMSQVIDALQFTLADEEAKSPPPPSSDITDFSHPTPRVRPSDCQTWEEFERGCMGI